MEEEVSLRGRHASNMGSQLGSVNGEPVFCFVFCFLKWGFPSLEVAFSRAAADFRAANEAVVSVALEFLVSLLKKL